MTSFLGYFIEVVQNISTTTKTQHFTLFCCTVLYCTELWERHSAGDDVSGEMGVAVAASVYGSKGGETYPGSLSGAMQLPLSPTTSRQVLRARLRCCVLVAHGSPP